MRRLAIRLACSGIRAYQLARSGRPSMCRYVPSCSVYARDALQRHGVVRGAWLTARRLARCHPWGSMGWDPVPSRDRAGRHANPVHAAEAVDV